MIDVIFQVPQLNYSTDGIPMPFVPSIGDQIFFPDFINEEVQESLFLTDNQIDLDTLTVAGVAWMRTIEATVYVMVTLTNE
ncbi:hypothetical protein SAMN05421847_2170 [Halpernia humi]|uniref:Uncharacterized protein n=1 Tax=Halpernia humi TaxID=493375 RepID=A0A1H5ZTP5_9FLAO|nr:hypothetical protein [Halpernia humi]SEG39077.1 hypothetical protein SAMN05421847_2170 [Halpernia humi]